MTRKSKARYGLKRTYRVNPTVKALRAALMAGLMATASTVALAAPPPVDIAIEYFESGDITVVNATDLDAEAIYAAGGIVAISDYGDVDITNDGNITADAGYFYGYNALAAGIYAEAGYDATVNNSGSISAYAYGSYGGPARALGIYAVAGAFNGYGDAEIQNSGAIEVTTYSSSEAQSIGIAAYAEDGDVTVGNTGQIIATSTVYADDYFTVSTATGISGYSEYGDVAITNSGLINVAAYVYDESGYAVSTASAIGIRASGYTVDIDNTASIAAFASDDVYLGNSIAIGIDAEAYADITISNTGDISLAGSSGDGYYYYSLGYPNYIRYTGDFVATGISAESYEGSISITNGGDITIVDQNPDGGLAGGFATGDRLTGIEATTLLGDALINNSGDLSLTGGEQAVGLIATTDQVTRYYACPPPYDNGYYSCYNRYGGGNATVVNSGDIDISVGVDQEYSFSYGVGIFTGTAKYGGDATVTNSGDITVINTAEGSANGIIARSTGKYAVGSSIVNNSGDIIVSASYSATGIGAYSTNDSSIYNSGDITVTTVEARARALYAVTDGVAYISNSGDLSVVGGIGAIGAGAAGAYGATSINTGDVSVTSTVYETGVNYYGEDYYLGGWAYGVFAASRQIGVAAVFNSGDIEVNGITRGTGLSANSRFGSTYIYNSGDLTVSGELESAYGINTAGNSYEEFLYGGTGYTTIVNLGDISATSNAFAVGIRASQAFANIQIDNAGAVSAVVDNGAYGNAFGISAQNVYGDIEITNLGDVTAASGANAGGILADTTGYGGTYYDLPPGDITILSDGTVSVTSDYGRASGITASTRYGQVEIAVAGSVEVSAYDRAFGVNAISNYGDVEIANYADVTVSSSNYNAAGLRALSEYYEAVVLNYGTIDVQAAGLAQGVVALSYYGSVEVWNEGDITASSTGGYSQAVAVRSYYGSQIVNFGTITAGSDAYAVAISVTGYGSDIINYGDISGSMITDDGDDYVYNGEDGRIFLTDDSIDLAGGYNYFRNEGKVYADGMNNVINMGYSGYGEGEGGYYGLFVNNGSSIHMNDGAADDALTIIGDFAGTGDVNVDVDGASLTSDMLYIDGNVLSGTENVINVDLLSLPSAADLNAGETITIVEVSGSSSVTDFVLGDVNVAAGALFTADYSLVYDGSEFALGFDITGLSTAGVLLTSASPAIQNMWYGSLGTMYQRQGGERQFLKDSGAADVHGAAGAWTRIYGSDGSITPSTNRNNFGDNGSQDFSFGNDGIEFGVGYSFTEAWTAGLLGGLAKGTYRPDAGGRGELTANTIGGYVTFTPGNGFYADLSYRDFSLDGDINGGGTKLPISGDASGYSLELGYGFKTKSGLEIEPQLQYSSMDVSLDDVGYNAGDFKLTDGDSDMFRAGVALRKSYEQNDGIWTPYTALSYVDVTSASNEYLIGGVLQGGVDMTGGSVLFELGTDAKYGDLLFNLGVSVQDGGPYEFVYGGQLNIRYTF